LSYHLLPHLPPLPLHDALPISSTATPASLTTTLAPSVANAFATAAPMPRPAPVTIATRPARREEFEESIRCLLFAARLTVAWSSDRKSTRLNSSHEWSSYCVFC